MSLSPCISLEEFCLSYPKVALAFSGGCDSSYLLSVLLDVQVEVKAYTAETLFQTPSDISNAKKIAQEWGVDLAILKIDILAYKEIRDNPPDRCYHCKRIMFETIRRAMQEEGYEVLVDGTNASDDPLHRPGFRALAEQKVLSPLRMAGLHKEEIRERSRKRGLSTADTPAFSCLATHLKSGVEITPQALDEVQQVLEEKRRLIYKA